MGGEPVVNVYEFDERLLKDGMLKFLEFENYSKDWAEFVFANRSSADGGSVHDYDVVLGPIANDRVGVQIRKYFDKEITLEMFLENLKYMKGVTHQYFSERRKLLNILESYDGSRIYDGRHDARSYRYADGAQRLIHGLCIRNVV